MVRIRNKLSSLRAGGPRQFTEIRDKLILKTNTIEERAAAAEKLNRLNLRTVQLSSAPVIVAEPEGRLEKVFSRVADFRQEVGDIPEAIRQIQEAREEGENVIDAAGSTLKATDALLEELSDIQEVVKTDFVVTNADFGPENLRVSPAEMDILPLDEADETPATLDKVTNKLNLPEAWEQTKGENTVIVIFDTAFSRDLISEDRVIHRFHDSTVNTVFKSDEGHGTMTSGAAAASKSMDGVPFNGAAPEANVALYRVTDDEGQMRSDIVAEAWDDLISRDFDGMPVIVNHSYGIPICSGRPKTEFCNDTLADLINIAAEDPKMTAVYAAGNEANTCGHRPSGLTNAITGHNSLSAVIAVGALLTSGQGIQSYTSHGRGDCAPLSAPKPEISLRIPQKTYYGAEDGWELKDMSYGLFGSSAGTSHAAPLLTGMIALMQSKSMEENGEALETEQIKDLLQANAKRPRISHISLLNFASPEGYDARVGFGEPQISEVLNSI